MLKNNSVVLQVRAALDRFETESAREVGVQFPLKPPITRNDTLYDKHIQYNGFWL